MADRLTKPSCNARVAGVDGLTRTFSSDRLTVTTKEESCELSTPGSAKLARTIADKTYEVVQALASAQGTLRELQDLARQDDNAEHPYKHIEFEELEGAVRVVNKSVGLSYYAWQMYAFNREDRP